MVRRCSAKYCQTNRTPATTGLIKVFRFPADPEERQRWWQAVPKRTPTAVLSDSSGLCEKHWPEGFKTVSKKGHSVPAELPSI